MTTDKKKIRRKKKTGFGTNCPWPLQPPEPSTLNSTSNPYKDNPFSFDSLILQGLSVFICTRASFRHGASYRPGGVAVELSFHDVAGVL
jgi:hypothetical protein